MAYTTIDDPSAHFQTALWTGTGSSQNITNDGNSDLKPDWVWIKERGQANNHKIYDSTRGTTKFLVSATNDAEGTDSNGLTAFLTDGFTLGGGGSHNADSNTYVGWQWKANGGTTSTNSDGTVNTTVQLNSTAGFSIVQWTGSGNTSGTIGHGLGVIPDMIIRKNTADAANWQAAFPKFETSKLLAFNLTSAFFNASGMSTYNTSTFVDGSGASSDATIAYCFKNIQGYSKIGKYIGNGNADGPFVHTGFKPAWLLIKNGSSDGNSWVLLDNKRQGFNVENDFLFPNATDAESVNLSNHGFDFLSNGFKNRGTGQNDDGDTFIYIAFAESPFVSSEGVPTTAR